MIKLLSLLAVLASFVTAQVPGNGEMRSEMSANASMQQKAEMKKEKAEAKEKKQEDAGKVNCASLNQSQCGVQAQNGVGACEWNGSACVANTAACASLKQENACVKFAQCSWNGSACAAA